MIQLYCNNILLDLYENTSLQFTRENPLFAFDKLKAERTTEFKLPCTPTNDGVFALARIPAYAGEGMRRRFSARMIDGVVQKNGYLYVSSFDGKDYNAIFLTLQYEELQDLKDLGKISESGYFDNYKNAVEISTPGTPDVGAYDARNTLWENVAYEQSDYYVNAHPSIAISKLMEELWVFDRDGIIESLNLRWIPKKMQPVQDETLRYYLEIKNNGRGSSAYVNIHTPYPTDASEIVITESQNSRDYFFPNAFFDGNSVQVMYTSGSTQYHACLTHKITKFATELRISSLLPNNYFIGYFNPQTGTTQNYGSLSDFHFLGGYSFDVQGNVTGTPLAGRTINLPAGQAFAFIKKEWWTANGWNIANASIRIPDGQYVWDFISVTATFSDYADNPPAIYRFKDNLPDCTVIDFLKDIAAMYGGVLYYEDDMIIIERDLTNGSTIELKDVISVSEVKRTFSDYAQRNDIEFAEDETQYNYEKEEIYYFIDNDNLEYQKTLRQLVAGNGSIYADHGDYQILLIRGGEEFGADIYARYDSQEPFWLCRAKLTEVQDIQDLCDVSTAVTLKARMTLMEYDTIKAKTKLLHDGQLYMWTSAKYSKGIVTFTLAKIKL